MADPVSKSLIAFALIVSFLLCSSHADSDVPFIVAHKKATLNKLKSGTERVFVTIDIYNQGTSYVFSFFSLLHASDLFLLDFFYWFRNVLDPNLPFPCIPDWLIEFEFSFLLFNFIEYLFMNVKFFFFFFC